jgi:hypothetical protein
MMGDPILLAEARKLLAPPIPPGPPPQSLSTPELLAGLPGRPNRVAHAAGRQAEDLNDPKSHPYYRSLAEAIARREHPADSLLRAWSQGMGPGLSAPGRSSRRPGSGNPARRPEPPGAPGRMMKSGGRRTRPSPVDVRARGDP